MEKKKLPIGISNYKELIDNNCYYIDKTMLIKGVVEGGKVILITRPRRFGKTLNQSMLRYFFEKTEEDTSYLYKNKKIWGHEEYRKYQGNYPVISLTFKDIQGLSYTETLSAIKELINEEYKKHIYLLESEKLNKYEKKDIEDIINRDINLAQYKKSLKKLSKYLHKHFNKKTIILLDEYDTPIIEAYQNKYYDKFINFFKTFLGAALKDSNSLEKGVVTGITKVAKESIFSDLNNLDVATVLKDFFNDKYGLLKEEVHEALDFYNLTYEEEDVISWYNGYNMRGIEIYNPYSIINLIHNKGRLQEYWINSSGNEIIKNLIQTSSAKFKDQVLQLINGKSIISEIEENMVFSDIDGRESNIWTLLLFSGYLKYVEQVGLREYKLMIPNKEVKFFYEYTVQNILKDRKIDLKNILNLLILGEIEDFKDNFKRLVKDNLSYFDTGGGNPEKFYHGLVLGMIIGLEDNYIIKSNRETAFGRADVILIPKDKTKKGFVFEFKKFSKTHDRDLMSSAKKGLAQIKNKKYIDEVKSYEVENVIAVAIAFKEKELEIVSNLDRENNLDIDTGKLETIENMLKKNMDIDLISEVTNIPKEEILRIKENI